MSTVIVPPFVMALVSAYRDPLLTWLSDRFYAQLLEKCEQHLLVQVHGVFDPAPLAHACEAYHHAPGTCGAPPLYSVSCLVRALLVGCLYHLSLRSLEERLRCDLVARWFCGLRVFADTPDHTTLGRFEGWVLQHHPRLYFDQVLSQLDVTGEGERDQIQVGDTFALQANSALLTRRKLLQHLTRRVLQFLGEQDASARVSLEARLNHRALFGEVNEPWDNQLSSEARHERLLATAREAQQCAQQVHAYLATPAASLLSPSARERLTTWLGYLDKVLADEFVLLPVAADQHKANPASAETHPASAASAAGAETDHSRPAYEAPDCASTADAQVASGHSTADTLQERPKDQRGTYRLVSANDPQATVRTHGESRVVGYNVQVAATPHVIREYRGAPRSGTRQHRCAVADPGATVSITNSCLPYWFTTKQPATAKDSCASRRRPPTIRRN